MTATIAGRPLGAIVRTALAPVRAAAKNQSERVSEELMGAVLNVLDQQGDWVHCRGEDGYDGWLHAGSLLLRASEEAEAWWDEYAGEPVVTLDATLNDEAARPLVRLPWGARLAMVGTRVRLPDGGTANIIEGRWVAWNELGSRFPQHGESVIATAREWMGVPYVWGGRTRWGTDCSGFVQSVYRLHGFLLPRDSYQQADVGEVIDADGDAASLRPGDLLFFRGRETERIVHVALSLGGSAMLHAAQENGCVTINDLHGRTELERSLTANLIAVRRLFTPS